MPDLIILDVMMPKIEDGIHTFYQLRTDPKFEHIPIIMLSAIARKTFFHSIMSFNSGKAEVAFSMYPVAVEDLINVSNAGEIMPPKSTWFEPKLRDGLVVHEI